MSRFGPAFLHDTPDGPVDLVRFLAESIVGSPVFPLRECHLAEKRFPLLPGPVREDRDSASCLPFPYGEICVRDASLKREFHG